MYMAIASVSGRHLTSGPYAIRKERQTVGTSTTALLSCSMPVEAVVCLLSMVDSFNIPCITHRLIRLSISCIKHRLIRQVKSCTASVSVGDLTSGAHAIRKWRHTVGPSTISPAICSMPRAYVMFIGVDYWKYTVVN